MKGLFIEELGRLRLNQLNIFVLVFGFICIVKASGVILLLIHSIFWLVQIRVCFVLIVWIDEALLLGGEQGVLVHFLVIQMDFNLSLVDELKVVGLSVIRPLVKSLLLVSIVENVWANLAWRGCDDVACLLLSLPRYAFVFEFWDLGDHVEACGLVQTGLGILFLTRFVCLILIRLFIDFSDGRYEFFVFRFIIEIGREWLLRYLARLFSLHHRRIRNLYVASVLDIKKCSVWVLHDPLKDGQALLPLQSCAAFEMKWRRIGRVVIGVVGCLAVFQSALRYSGCACLSPLNEFILSRCWLIVAYVLQACVSQAALHLIFMWMVY